MSVEQERMQFRSEGVTVIDGSEPLVQRQLRYQISTPMRYRLIGEKMWHEGRTLNISTTGLLFEAETVPDVGTHIEIRFELPVEPLLGTLPFVSCRGIVVRSRESPILAAKISAARIKRR